LLEICADIWLRLDPSRLPEKEKKVEFLLWALFLIRQYPKETVGATLAGGVHEQTLRDHVWHFVDRISQLEVNVVSVFGHRERSVCFRCLTPFQIDFEKRRIGDDGSDCLLTIGGTHFPIEARGKRWYSHKFKKPGMASELGLCIKTGHIVWLAGPLPAGEWNNISIFRLALKHKLDPNERVATDKGYCGECPAMAKTPGPLYTDEHYIKMMGGIAARHEAANNRLKMFECLKQRFRHGVASHAACFRAVAVVVQLQIEFGEPLFDAEYSDK
jgi:hypothetical protein